ncbi:TatD family hydrolase [sulfur-oxidizing endosymbiont of Gigantopelta aegis]|uniref:TatD family hydrolase n=1 Tax=sulfur-oxidizing endosymbiont of Gigantopelta aegis TaxID=2794934 RepID=UPI0018DBE02F|nr:TatD family hydrolase [sulfur-oxidizing endosymbiont of Gigantopelta aegis]
MSDNSIANGQFIDSHCHLDFPAFDADRTHIIEACQALNFTAIVVPGVCRQDWQALLATCQENDLLAPALGLHPCFVTEHHRDDLDLLAQFCQSEPIVALGEIGLDFFIFKNSMFKNSIFKSKAEAQNHQKEKQLFYFSQQLDIAAQHQLPVLIHARKSHEQVIQQLKGNTSLRGIIHAFSGSYEQAKEYLKLGFKLGFGGAFTYPQATKLRSLVPRLPLEAWVLETDAPDMSPEKYHGQRNSPQYLTEIVQTFLDLYNSRSENEKIIVQLYTNTLDVLPRLKAAF